MLTNLIPEQYKLTAKIVGALVLPAAVAAAGALAARSYYLPKLNASQSALERLSGAVEQQGRQAQALLAQLTAERDAKQAQLDAAKAAQETKDEQAQKQIAALTAQSRSQPIRVRLASCEEAGAAGGGSASPATQGSQPAAPGAADAAEAFGILPGRNAESLIELMQEAEQINAAYSSCRATLETWAGVLDAPPE